LIAFSASAFSEDVTFGVITYNLWQWGKIKPAELAKIVEKSEASIVGLMESWDAALNEKLLDCLGWNTILYGGKDTPNVKSPEGREASFWINGFYMPQVLATRYEVMEHKYYNTINAKEFPDFELPIHRGGILAKLRLPSGDIICVFVLHLMPWRDVEPQRLEEIKSIVGKLKPYAEVPTIIMGDFNTPSHLDGAEGKSAWVTEYLQSQGFQDSYRVVHPDPDRHPGKTCGRRIDYVFASKHFVPLECTVLEEGVFGSEGFEDSDHLAVYAKLKLVSRPTTGPGGQTGETPGGIKAK
jgi:endonuclease/exonuclease/phosphatase family metal-dependent hydrolase